VMDEVRSGRSVVDDIDAGRGLVRLASAATTSADPCSEARLTRRRGDSSADAPARTPSS
jgi:hypothetical protein